MPKRTAGKMTLKDFESFFDNEPSLSSRNARSRAIARDILVFGKTQRQTATDNHVTLGYVNKLMKPVFRAYNRIALPTGYVLLENLVLPTTEAASVLRLSRATKNALKKAQKGGVA